MGKVTGFKEWRRQGAARRPVRLRVLDYHEIDLERPARQVQEQAGRCIDCGVPFCQQGCPLGNAIPDFNEWVYREHWKHAFEALESTNNFPELTGRLCPAPCEAACVLRINDEPVTIEQIEKEIIERAFGEGWVKPRPPQRLTGRSIAIVGSGPAGLAAATQLRRAGHDVTVYERDDRIGGLLRYGIPDFKLEKWVIDRRVELMRAEGVEFVTHTEAGVDVAWTELKERHDAMLLTVGALAARDLPIEGRELDGVHLAMEYLTQQNRRNAGDELSAAAIDARGKRVVILGGGDTGSDCLGTAHRQGAASTLQLELMPAPPQTPRADNPWPRWPLVLRTSSSQEEGGEREFAVMTDRFTGVDGRVTQLHAIRVDAEHDATGCVSLHARPGTEFAIDVDLVVLALGFNGPATETLVDQLGVELDTRGAIRVDAGFRTSVRGVYAAGDASRGASLVVWAISDGREAARQIDADLLAVGARLPTRGRDAPFA
jgi:glutamate synthase (NADPH/NADH) small chain